MKIWTSEEIRDMWDQDDGAMMVAEAVFPTGCPGTYRLTQDEYQALRFIQTWSYTADVLYRACQDESDDFDGSEVLLTLDPTEVGAMLAYDGVDKLPGLSEDTTLQLLVWLCYTDDLYGQTPAEVLRDFGHTNVIDD